jgi:putative oxidoreductase
MSPSYQRYVPVLARLLMCIIFLLSGFDKLMHWSESEAYMTTHGLTTATGLLLAAAIIVEILGGLALLLGFALRPVAVILFLYLIPTTLIFHNFWAVAGSMRQDQMHHFLKNVAILGGLLEASVAGAGTWSVDESIARWRRPFWAVWRRPVA